MPTGIRPNFFSARTLLFGPRGLTSGERSALRRDPHRAFLVSSVALLLLLFPSASKASNGVLLVNYNAKDATVLKVGELQFVADDKGTLVPEFKKCVSENCIKLLEDQPTVKRAIVTAVGGSYRWIGTKGEKLYVLALYEGPEKSVPEVGYKEVARSTVIAQQFGLILAGVFGFEATKEKVMVVHDEHELTLKRATLTVTIPADAAKQAAAETPAAGKPTTTAVTAVLTTGPAELAFLSADTVFNKISQKTWNKTTQKVQVRDAPNHPYAGINIALNDVLSSKWNPYLKGLVSIQSKPLDSWGLGAGLKLPSLLLGSFNVNTIAPFVAVTWDRSSATLPSGAFVDGHRYKTHLRGGISLDVAGIAKAIKGGGAGATTTAKATKP
jgi:hypothetical protein